MAHPLKHAEGSARKFGGKAEEYLAIHSWFDESKSFSQISATAHSAIMPKGSSCASVSSVSQSPTAKANRCQCATSENSTCARISGAYPPHKTGCPKSSPPAGCTADVLSKTIPNSIPNKT